MTMSKLCRSGLPGFHGGRPGPATTDSAAAPCTASNTARATKQGGPAFIYNFHLKSSDLLQVLVVVVSLVGDAMSHQAVGLPELWQGRQADTVKQALGAGGRGPDFGACCHEASCCRVPRVRGQSGYCMSP